MDNLIGSKIDHEKYGEGVISGYSTTSYTVYFRNHGEMQISRSDEAFETLRDGASVNDSIGLEDIELAITNVLERYADFTVEIPLGDKWIGGNISINPADASQQSKEIPIETFFHKIVMVRDRLRVLEQNINSNKSLNDEEKVNLQQYITRAYGSLTTFNILFAKKDHQFKGASKS